MWYLGWENLVPWKIEFNFLTLNGSFFRFFLDCVEHHGEKAFFKLMSHLSPLSSLTLSLSLALSPPLSLSLSFSLSLNLSLSIYLSHVIFLSSRSSPNKEELWRSDVKIWHPCNPSDTALNHPPSTPITCLPHTHHTMSAMAERYIDAAKDGYVDLLKEATKRDLNR